MGYTIDGNIGKTLILERDKKYYFNINGKGHPFYFTTNDTGGNISYPGFIYDQTQPTDCGMVTFQVPMNAPQIFYYQCGLHHKMGGYVMIQN